MELNIFICLSEVANINPLFSYFQILHKKKSAKFSFCTPIFGVTFYRKAGLV